MTDRSLTEKKLIESGGAILGIELGSTRIKAVLIDEKGNILATGGHDWENSLVDGIWTYELSEAIEGLQKCYGALADCVRKKYGLTLRTLKALGISGMMHGYIPFNENDEQISRFRTWRNSMTEEAADELTELFQYNIPQRWSVAHLYHSLLKGEEHVKDIAYMTTLSGYIHWQLTGQKVLGIGDASGMFPIDCEKKDFHARMLDQLDQKLAEHGISRKMRDIFPQVLVAGQNAGYLTEDGAKLLDLSGNLQAGIPMCPPEADGATGMVATNSVAKRTGNVSAGTSAFAMVVLEKELSKVYRQLDMVTTPEGALVAMAHAANCTTEINAWVNMIEESLRLFGSTVSKSQIFEKLFLHSLEGDLDGGGLLPYCFHSGEHAVEINEGCPIFLHPATASFNLANFIRTQVYTCFGAMKLGMDLLTKEEHVSVEKILAHGGIFKTPGVAQRYLAAAMERPVVVMETAGEGGPWGVALLAAYMSHTDLSLAEYLAQYVFEDAAVTEIEPRAEEIAGYDAFMASFKAGIPVEKKAVEWLHA